jgi:hypothetical protein
MVFDNPVTTRSFVLFQDPPHPVTPDGGVDVGFRTVDAIVGAAVIGRRTCAAASRSPEVVCGETALVPSS